MQRIDLPDAKAANTQILDDLSNGANGITLVFEGAVGDYGYALPATEEAVADDRSMASISMPASRSSSISVRPPGRSRS